MKRVYHFSIVALVIFSLCLTPVFAEDISLTTDDIYCFSPENFPQNETGIFVTAVPSPALGRVKLGARTICAGDVLTQDSLNKIVFIPTTDAQGDAILSCISISDTGALTDSELTIRIHSARNEAPTAEDQEFETYKNIPGEIVLKATDPEGDPLTVQIIKEPKRGTVTVSAEGTVIYTPEKNKVGKDTFVYTVTDTAGNTSPEATVHIKIAKPSHQETYADLQGDSVLLAATWLREMDVYSGEVVSGNSLFQPDETLSRGEFLAMCVSLTTQTEPEALSVGFVDDAATPLWLTPYVTEAVKCGYLSGVPTEDGLALLAHQDISRGEAAVIVSNMLSLSGGGTETVMGSQDALPAWAASSVSAVMDAGIFDASEVDMLLTRREAAQLLYDAWHLENENSLLAWAKE